MPISAPKPCGHHGCGKLVSDGRYCPEHKREQPQRDHGSAGKRVTGRRGMKDRERIKRRDLGLCQACYAKGILTEGTQVDHIVPLSAGGSDDDSNKQLLCTACHKVKSASDRRT